MRNETHILAVDRQFFIIGVLRLPSSLVNRAMQLEGPRRIRLAEPLKPSLTVFNPTVAPKYETFSSAEVELVFDGRLGIADAPSTLAKWGYLSEEAEIPVVEARSYRFLGTIRLNGTCIHPTSGVLPGGLEYGYPSLPFMIDRNHIPALRDCPGFLPL